MTTMSMSTEIAVNEPAFTNPERLALAGFLAGYSGLTREAYALDLRQYASSCQQHHLRLFQHALISLLALNGLRVSEAVGADIQNMGTERGQRTLVVTRKGGKIATIPLAPRTAQAIDLAVGERCDGPVFLGPDGRRLDRHGAARIVRRSPDGPESPRR